MAGLTWHPPAVLRLGSCPAAQGCRHRSMPSPGRRESLRQEAGLAAVPGLPGYAARGADQAVVRHSTFRSADLAAGKVGAAETLSADHFAQDADLQEEL